MIMKTATEIATKNLVASGDESLRDASLRATCDQAGYKPPKKAVFPRRPGLLLLMPDPVNDWTRPVVHRRERQLCGALIRYYCNYFLRGVHPMSYRSRSEKKDHRAGRAASWASSA
jgi:hypothetical protein